MTDTFDINGLLRKIATKNVSDIHLTLGKAPALRIMGSIVRVKMNALTEKNIDDIIKIIAPKDFYQSYSNYKNYDFTYVLDGVSRYRVNYSKNFGNPQIVLRTIPFEPLLVKDLDLPESLNDITQLNNGIVFFTGATGSGKSTSIAALIETINREKTKHIITIEDPIEFIFNDKSCIVTQKALGSDVESYALGIKYALRQDPDVIVVGEIRDRQTMEAALAAAETGHLVLTTIHANSAINTIDRVINLFDEQIRGFMLERLANSLRYVISQKLLPIKEGKGRLPVAEILSVTPTIKDYIVKKNYDEIYELMRRGDIHGMSTLNNAIYALYKADKITKEVALDYSDEKIELTQMMSGSYTGTAGGFTGNYV